MVKAKLPAPITAQSKQDWGKKSEKNGKKKKKTPLRVLQYLSEGGGVGAAGGSENKIQQMQRYTVSQKTAIISPLPTRKKKKGYSFFLFSLLLIKSLVAKASHVCT